MKRIRFSLRLMLLLVALAAVFFAWIGAMRELRRVQIRGVLIQLEISHKYIEGRASSHPDPQYWDKYLREIDEEIAVRRQQLGEPDG